MRLNHNGKNVALEPKVLEVLLFFIDNTDRYITLQELHDTLWSGRIVSDAAVRRIISKLRILFNDDHKTPNYIKSLSKRGYKLICNIEYYDEPSNESLLSSSSSTLENNNPHVTIKPIKHNSLSNKAHISKKQMTLTGCILVFILFAAGVLYFEFNTNKTMTSSSLVINKVIKSLPGDKIAISQSLDDQYLAFSGRVSEEQGYQIFIKQNEVHNFIAISSPAFLPLSLAFSTDSKNLFYSDLKEGNSSLNMIPLSSSVYRKETLLQGYFSIGNIFTSTDVELIYFSGQKHQDEPRLIYSYNIKTKKTKQITHSTQDYYSDIKGSISSTGEFLAVVRYSAYEQTNEIKVINLKSNDIIYRRRQQNPIYDLKWLDTQHLLLMDKEQLFKINISNKQEVLINEFHNLESLHVLNKEHFLAIKYNEPNRIFFEQTLPFKSWGNKFVFNIPSDIYSINHLNDSHSKLTMSIKNNVITLGKLNTQTSESTSYIETEYELEYLDYSVLIETILIKINHRFALFNIKKNSLDYITYSDEFIGDASFSSDKQGILFSVKSYDLWEVKFYDIKNKSIDSLLKGFRYIRPFKHNYIVADAQENLFF
jgi:DNA-binding winged helix-turn-helix (wHTH) protein